MKEVDDQQAVMMIGFALDVIYQDLDFDPEFRVAIHEVALSRLYTISFNNREVERMSVDFRLRSYDVLTIPSETLATIALILS